MNGIPLLWAVSHGIMSGTNRSEFSLSMRKHFTFDFAGESAS